MNTLPPTGNLSQRNVNSTPSVLMTHRGGLYSGGGASDDGQVGFVIGTLVAQHLARRVEELVSVHVGRCVLGTGCHALAQQFMLHAVLSQLLQDVGDTDLVF